ncbi:CDP-glycerol glycerophosphotransferase family protein [Actinomadura sp. NPDC047616]|uniref:bifunctional glycosyltransferase/CDP-glycerol:glycerophosphate glycerophosphotransferase n=1 Tax=Actinomadura sp. NPDC047616 TaxID=3155914 RepID=UPI0033C86D76
MSVVVIAFNDAGRLPRAVGSALRQSLSAVEVVVVDDGSTDGTGLVAERLAAEHPGRMRVVRLPVNSGGCGRPRNAGVERARGRYVMFLDSDDVLDPHACLNLLTTAEDTGADLVSGLCTRVHMDRVRKRERPWYPWLYQRTAVYGALCDNPDLLYDTLATNKLYRRAFLERHGLRFAERLHYEDLLFTAEAYLAASRTALIPHRVYNWLVEPHTRSISSRRSELANFADRLEIHRRIDALLRRHGDEELRLAKDVKFVNHDLLLYMRDLPCRDAVYREGFRALAADYLAGLDPRVYEAASPMAAIAAYLLREGDQDGALAAAEYPVLGAELVQHDKRVFWSGRYASSREARRILDVTHLGLQQCPLSELRPLNVVTGLTVRDGRARLRGHVLNPLGRVAGDATMTASLELSARLRPRRVFRVTATVTHAGDRLLWAADFDPVRQVGPVGVADAVWDVRLRLNVDGEEVVTRLSGRELGGAVEHVLLPVRPRLSRLAAGSLRPYITTRGNLAFVLHRSGRAWRTARAAAKAPLGRRALRSARRTLRAARRLHRAARRAVTSRTTKTAVFNHVLSRLPVRTGTVVFESHMGRHYADNPKYIHRELRRAGVPVRAVWAYDSSPRGFPKDAVLVRRNSWAYHWELARAQFWIDNQGFPGGLRKRPQTTYIQTWHGSAFKLMGFDQPRIKRAGRAERARLRRMVERYDCFLIRSRHDVDTLVRGLGVRAELVPAGYPRNDPLVNADPDVAAEAQALRRSLDLDDGRRVVLYAPTFRRGPDGEPVRHVDPPIEPRRFAREFGDVMVLLVRPHYLCRTRRPAAAGIRALDAGRLPDVTPLLLLADALITDHSSLMFDYALLDRPMILHVPDPQTLGGGYFDLTEHAPGPVTATEDDLVAALADLDCVGARYARRRRAFVQRFGEYDRGTAARAVVERFFTTREGARDG